MAILSQEEIDNKLIELSKAYDDAIAQNKSEGIEGVKDNEVHQIIEVMVYENGMIYEGGLMNGIPNGKGKMIFPDGKSVTGKWKDGKYFMYEENGALSIEETINLLGIEDLDTENLFLGFSGFAKMNYGNGNVYEGDFAEGKPHGKRKLTQPDGRVEEGKWKNGEFKGKGFLGGLFGKK